MTLAIVSLALLAALAGYRVWCVANRLWQLLVIFVMAALLFPVVAIRFTGDVSYYFPAGTFSEGIDGKDQIVIASAIATMLVAIILAACAWGAAKVVWQSLRSWKK
jgi:hypothetical protein